MYILKLFQKVLNSVTNNLVLKLNTPKTTHYSKSYTTSIDNTQKYNTYVLGSNCSKNSTFTDKNAIFSKSLSQVKNQLTLTNYSTHNNISGTSYQLVRNILHNTLQSKLSKNCFLDKYNITRNESYYVDSKAHDFTKTKTTQINLNDIHKMSKVVGYPSHFNFNLKTNLILAQQQR
jgi:hypothetical protein